MASLYISFFFLELQLEQPVTIHDLPSINSPLFPSIFYSISFLLHFFFFVLLDQSINATLETQFDEIYY